MFVDTRFYIGFPIYLGISLFFIIRGIIGLKSKKIVARYGAFTNKTYKGKESILPATLFVVIGLGMMIYLWVEFYL